MCRVAYTESGGYCVPLASQHRPAAEKILQGSVYEPETIRFLAENCRDGDIVHAGTYFGDFLPALSRACAAGATLWAFEPNRENFRCAAITCAINDLPNVALRHAGLGAREGTATMVVRDGDGQALGGGSRIALEGSTHLQSGTEAVEIVALDDVVPADRHVSMIHLDVEGYEEPCLTGALGTISRCCPILVVETLPDEAWLAAHLFRLGYTVDQRIHQNTVLMPPSRSLPFRAGRADSG